MTLPSAPWCAERVAVAQLKEKWRLMKLFRVVVDLQSHSVCGRDGVGTVGAFGVRRSAFGVRRSAFGACGRAI